MADNSTTNAGAGGDTFRTDDNAGVKTPVSKVEFGLDGVFSEGFWSKDNPGAVAGNTVKDGTGTKLAFLLDSDGHSQIDVLSCALPSGAATAAKQPALGTAGTAAADVLTVQGIAAMVALKVDGSAVTQPVSIAGTVTVASHAVTNAGTFAVQAAQAGTWTVDLGATDNAVLDAIAASLAGTLTVGSHAVTNAGTFAVQVSSALPTGTNSIGQVTANAGTNLNTSALALESGGNLAAAATSLALLDNAISGNEMQVDVVAALPAGSNVIGGVTQSGTWTVDGTFWQATQPVSIASTVTVTGAGGSFPVTDSGGSLTVDAPVGTPVFVRLSDGIDPIAILPVSLASVPSHAVTNAGTFAVQAAQSGTWSVDLGATDNGVLDAIAASLAGTLTVGSHAVTNAGTFVVQVDGTALARLTDIETNTDSGAVVGNGTAATAQRVTLANDSTGVLATVTTVTALTGGGVAHDAADSGNPHKIGAKAESSLSGVTLVADGDRTDLHAGVDGVLITRPHCNLEDIVSGNASNTDGASTQCIAAQASGIKTYLTSIILTNTSSSNIYVEIKDGATAKLTIPVPANGGAIVPLPVPLGGTAATAWNFDPSAAATTVRCSMVGFKSKV